MHNPPNAKEEKAVWLCETNLATQVKNSINKGNQMLSEERIARIYEFYLETTLLELLNWKKEPLEFFNFYYL